MERDPVVTNPEFYRLVMENDRVRVLEYRDRPTDRTVDHAHPDSVMIALSSFRRRLVAGERTAEVELEAGTVRWLAAQSHLGENIGETDTHAIFIELKESAAGTAQDDAPLGPSSD